MASLSFCIVKVLLVVGIVAAIPTPTPTQLNSSQSTTIPSSNIQQDLKLLLGIVKVYVVSVQYCVSIEYY